jgi:hypothetical protein
LELTELYLIIKVIKIHFNYDIYMTETVSNQAKKTEADTSQAQTAKEQQQKNKMDQAVKAATPQTVTAKVDQQKELEKNLQFHQKQLQELKEEKDVFFDQFAPVLDDNPANMGYQPTSLQEMDINEKLAAYDQAIEAYENNPNDASLEVVKTEALSSIQALTEAKTKYAVRQSFLTQMGAEISNLAGKLADEGMRYAAATLATLKTKDIRKGLAMGNLAAGGMREVRAQLSNASASNLDETGSVREQLVAYNGTLADRSLQTSQESLVGLILPSFSNPVAQSAMTGVTSAAHSVVSDMANGRPVDIKAATVAMGTGTLSQMTGVKLGNSLNNQVIATATGNAADLGYGVLEGVMNGASLRDSLVAVGREGVANIAGQTAFAPYPAHRVYQEQLGEVKKEFDEAYSNPVTPKVYNEGFLNHVMLSRQSQTLKVPAPLAQQNGLDHLPVNPDGSVTLKGQYSALMVFDANKFSTYDKIVGRDKGDAAIEVMSQLAHDAAADLNERYSQLPPDHPDAGLEFTAYRKSGDEFALTATYKGQPFEQLPADASPEQIARALRPYQGLSDSAVKDMVTTYQNAVAQYNATHDEPMPTSSLAARVITPGEFISQTGLNKVSDELDEAAVETFNSGNDNNWQRNAGVVITQPQEGQSSSGYDLLPGPLYQLTDPMRDNEPLLDFRRQQGGVEDADLSIDENGRPLQAEAYPNILMQQEEGAFSRPFILPDASFLGASDQPLLSDESLLNLSSLRNPDDIARYDLKTVREQTLLASQIADRYREGAPLEANFRHLYEKDDVRILNLPAGEAELNAMIAAAREKGGNARVTLLSIEPRGLKPSAYEDVQGNDPASFKDINDLGYIELAEGADSTVYKTGHTGGNAILEYMVQAHHEAAKEVFGEHYSDHVKFFRQRGKRFMIAMDHKVTTRQIQQFTQRATEIYKTMDPVVQGPDGKNYTIQVEGRQNDQQLKFQHAFAGENLNVSAFPDLTASRLMERIVGPLDNNLQSITLYSRRNPLSSGLSDTFSLMDVAKISADGGFGNDAHVGLMDTAAGPTPVRFGDIMPVSDINVQYFITPLGENSRRNPQQRRADNEQ